MDKDVHLPPDPHRGDPRVERSERGPGGGDLRALRIERDSLGEIPVAAGAYWGAQTQRALAQAPILGRPMPESLLRALALIKRSAAEVNLDLGRLDERRARAIVQAADEVASGRWRDHFPLDLIQTGSGTSSHMNVNEVIANRASEILGAPLGRRDPVHPNDHVNLGQSSNDVFPTAIHIAVLQAAGPLLAALARLRESLERKSREFAEIVKPGRTHLQDAVPVTLGQEFSGYAHQILEAERRLRATLPALEELALGGTAAGTGLGTHPRFAAAVIARLSAATGLPLREAPNRFAALAARDALVEWMGMLNATAVAAMKIANDLRLLASGPRTGLGELRLPALQPGSSIMPGKVNPVLPEIVMQAAARVMGHQVSVTIGGQHGPLELNVMMPLIADSALESTELLARSLRLLAERCVEGIEADAGACAAAVERSLALATPLAARFGYDRAAEIAHQAWREGRSVREVVIAAGLLSEAEAAELLDPGRLSKPAD